MKTKKFVYILVLLLIASCSTSGFKEENQTNQPADKIAASEETEESHPAASDTIRHGFISSGAARANSDTSRKFVRTANVKFKVNDVRKSTLAIEDIVSGCNGFVTYTTLNSEVSSRNEIPVSEDSVLVTTRFTVRNNMTIRIPDETLDSALRAIAGQIEFLDFRNITAEDVTLQMLSNKFLRRRLTAHGNRLHDAIDKRGKKLNETTHSEEKLLDRQIQSDQALIENYKLQSMVDYSTLQLEFYQDESVVRELKYNDEDIEEFRPGFWPAVGEAFGTGWAFVKLLFIGIITIWPLLVLGLGIYLMVKRLLRK